MVEKNWKSWIVRDFDILYIEKRLDMYFSFFWLDKYYVRYIGSSNFDVTSHIYINIDIALYFRSTIMWRHINGWATVSHVIFVRSKKEKYVSECKMPIMVLIRLRNESIF